MEDARLLLAADVVGGPAQESPVVQLRHGRVGDDTLAAGSAEVTAGDVYCVGRVVERPAEGVLLWVGVNSAAHLGVLVAAHSVRGDLPRRTHGGVCKRKRPYSASD